MEKERKEGKNREREGGKEGGREGGGKKISSWYQLRGKKTISLHRTLGSQVASHLRSSAVGNDWLSLLGSRNASSTGLSRFMTTLSVPRTRWKPSFRQKEPTRHFFTSLRDFQLPSTGSSGGRGDQRLPVQTEPKPWADPLNSYSALLTMLKT